MSRKPTDKEKKEIRNIAIGGTAVGTLGAGGAYVTSARNKQKEIAADKMVKEYHRRLQAGHDSSEFKPPKHVQGKRKGEAYKKGTQTYERAHEAWKRGKFTRDGKIKTVEQVPGLKKKYSRYAKKVAKLTGTKWVEKPRMGIDEKTLEKVQVGQRGRQFKAKGLVSLLGLFPRASLRNKNLIGKLALKSQKYTGKSRGGRETVGGLTYSGRKQNLSKKDRVGDPTGKWKEWNNK